MTYEKLPSRLKQGKNFCLYRNEPGTDGKKKKVPYQANGARAAPNNPVHFTDYTTVYEAFKQGGYGGIGLLVTENMEVVDVDDCVDEEGNLSSLAREIVDTIDTYTEISPSGRGIHTIAFTDNPNKDGAPGRLGALFLWREN